MNRNSGFSFIDIVVVTAIIALLASVAIPSYNSQMQKTRRAEGQAKLLEVMHAQAKHYRENSTYVTDLRTLGYDAATEKSANEFYTVTASSCETGINQCVKLTANANLEQMADGSLTLDSVGRKERVLSNGNVRNW